jgi:hypothetical protein
MKKLLYSIFLGLLFTVSACTSFNNSVKVISRCCKAITMIRTADTLNEKDKEAETSNASSILPVNSWDGKMLIW